MKIHIVLSSILFPISPNYTRNHVELKKKEEIIIIHKFDFFLSIYSQSWDTEHQIRHNVDFFLFLAPKVAS